MHKYFKAKIRENIPINSKNNLLTLEPLEPVIEPAPGQFYMIEVSTSHDPLLKRPFCYFRRTPDAIQFLFTIRGRGTALMGRFEKNRVIHIIGPLGTGYPFLQRGHTPLLVAGGTGIISLFSFMEKLSCKPYLLYGAKTKDDILLLHELEKLGEQCIVCTDDCSLGRKGLVDDALLEFLEKHKEIRTSCILYTCGPKPMLRSIAKIALDKGLKGYVSLEENMACGFGACLGCAVQTVNGYKRVCKEGPVFPIEDIVWQQE